MLNVVIDGLGGDDKYGGDLFDRIATGQQSQDLDFALAETGCQGLLRAPDRMPGGGQHAVDSRRIEATSPHFLAQMLGGLVRAAWRPVWTELGHSLVDVRSRQD